MYASLFFLSKITFLSTYGVWSKGRAKCQYSTFWDAINVELIWHSDISVWGENVRKLNGQISPELRVATDNVCKYIVNYGSEPKNGNLYSSLMIIFIHKDNKPGVRDCSLCVSLCIKYHVVSNLLQQLVQDLSSLYFFHHKFSCILNFKTNILFYIFVK